MIDILAPVALLASGGYLVYKSSGDKDDKTTAPKGGQTGLTALQKLQLEAEAREREAKTNSPAVVENANARGNETVSTTNNKTQQQINSKLYFGDPDGAYDQFYDYTNEAGASEDLFTGTKLYTDKDGHGRYFRSRIVSPFFGESRPVKMTEFGENYYTVWGDVSKDTVYCNDTHLQVRSAYRGSYRNVGFVLEVFNPFHYDSQLKQIIIRNVKMGGKACHVVNINGWCHAAWQNGNVGHQAIMNKLYTLDSNSNNLTSGTLKDIPAPMIWSCDVKIPKRSSVLIPVFLQLATTELSRVTISTDDFFYKNTPKSFLVYKGDHRYGVAKEKEKVTGGLLYNDAIRADAGEGVCMIVFNQLSAPPSLKDGHDFSCDINLSSGGTYTINKTGLNKDSKDYEQNTKDCSATEHLSLVHSYRKGYETVDSYQTSYIGDYEGKTPMQADFHVENALGNCIMTIMKGEPLEDGFPSLIDGNVEYKFKNDFAHRNYCY